MPVTGFDICNDAGNLFSPFKADVIYTFFVIHRIFLLFI